MAEVAPQIFSALAAAGTFEVHDLDDARIDPAHVARAGGLDHHAESAPEQREHQRMDCVLQQWLAAGYLDQRTAMRLHLLDDFGDGHPAPLAEGVFGVA